MRKRCLGLLKNGLVRQLSVCLTSQLCCESLRVLTFDLWSHSRWSGRRRESDYNSRFRHRDREAWRKQPGWRRNFLHYKEREKTRSTNIRTTWCVTHHSCFFDYHELNMGTLLKVCLMFVSFSQAVAGGGKGLTVEEQSWDWQHCRETDSRTRAV